MGFFQFSENIDMTGILGEYAVTKILDNILERNNKEVVKSSKKFIDNSKRKSLENAILKEFINTLNWSSTIKDNQFNFTNILNSVYVDLDILLTPVTSSVGKINNLPKDKFENIYKQYSENIIVVGNPGAGKTTLMKNFCNSLAKRINENEQIPIVILLRDLDRDIFDTSNNLFLFKYLLSLFKIDIEFGDNIKEKDFIRNTTRRCVKNFLEEWNIALVLDGFDEVVNQNRRELLKEEILNLTRNNKKNRILVTSRFGENLPMNRNISVFQISSLNDSQIDEFISNYLPEEKEKQEDFKSRIISSTFSDTIRRPLILSLYCYYYNHYGFLPERPSLLYSKVTRLLLEEWSKLNSIKRLSNFSNFNFDIKAKFLREFAFFLTFKIKKLDFNQRTFDIFYSSIFEKYKLKEEDSHKVLEEIQTHNGLIIPIDGETYSFSHKSIQEFLVADYLIRLGEIPVFSLIDIPNEIAIATSISDNSNKYFFNIVINQRIIGLRKFSRIFLNRLMIEKPEFYADPLLGLALISLYNDLKKIELYDTRKKSTHRDDRVLFKTNDVLLKLFSDSIIIKSINQLLEEYYPIKSKKEYSEKDCKVYYFKRKKTFIGMNNDLIPKYIAMTDKYVFEKLKQ